MDGLVVADLKGVLAPLNFTAPMAEKPYSYNYEPPADVPWETDTDGGEALAEFEALSRTPRTLGY